MIPEAHISHEMPFRIRIKIPSKKGDARYFASVQDQLSGLPGIAAVGVNPATAGVLILHDRPTKEILAFAKKQKLFMTKVVARPHKTLFDSVADTFRGYDQNLRGLTGGQIDIPSLVFLSLLVSGLYQIARGNFVMPAWYTAFYYALSVFSRARVDEFDEGEDLSLELEDADGD